MIGEKQIKSIVYTEKKSCGTKPKKGFVHAMKPLKGLLVCNEIEILFSFVQYYETLKKISCFFVIVSYNTKKPSKKLRVSGYYTKLLQRLMKYPINYFEGFVALYETKKGLRFRCKLINLLMVLWQARNPF